MTHLTRGSEPLVQMVLYWYYLHSSSAWNFSPHLVKCKFYMYFAFLSSSVFPNNILVAKQQCHVQTRKTHVRRRSVRFHPGQGQTGGWAKYRDMIPIELHHIWHWPLGQTWGCALTRGERLVAWIQYYRCYLKFWTQKSFCEIFNLNPIPFYSTENATSVV